ncbi:Leucine-rich repeat-containing protein 15 [Holothuria leucospilota]|uniref:Leucine-rich repeat-containing protein 15 n=1 Tax=Holothuria leucospilota TaxID=206669 RepID=A0A9Q1CGT8_HOLLE|nr:Leucine-rich repeat-containing protein 15 [Holothuria leucospilota]
MSHYDVWDSCERPFPSGCCKLGHLFVCNGVNVTHVDNFADEIPQHCTSLTIANANNSFINNGYWKFLSNLTYLEDLAFYNNKISSLSDLKPVYIEDLENLKFLTLAFGELRTFPVEIFHTLASLEYLSLQCNKLQNISEGNWNFPLLNNLIMSHNRIATVGIKHFKGLENLAELDLSYNRISHFSLKVLDSMPNLKYLRLSFNQLVYISDFSHQHAHLLYFALSSNLFVSLEGSVFNGLKSVRTIEFSSNSIKDPPSVNSKNNVTSALALSLESNLIEVLSPLFFDHFPYLNLINVDFNRIHHIEENTFRSVPNVTSISMRGNAIHIIPRQLFQHLQNLNFIELQVNRIQNLDPYIFNQLSKHVQVYIQNNPIVCDCQALPLLKWLSASGMSIMHFPTCQSPKPLENQNIYYATLPQDCPASTLMPVSTNVTPTEHPNTFKDQNTLIFLIGLLLAPLICSCLIPLCAVCRSSHEDSE